MFVTTNPGKTDWTMIPCEPYSVFKSSDNLSTNAYDGMKMVKFSLRNTILKIKRNEIEKTQNKNEVTFDAL